MPPDTRKTRRSPTEPYFERDTIVVRLSAPQPRLFERGPQEAAAAESVERSMSAPCRVHEPRRRNFRRSGCRGAHGRFLPGTGTTSTLRGVLTARVVLRGRPRSDSHHVPARRVRRPNQRRSAGGVTASRRCAARCTGCRGLRGCRCRSSATPPTAGRTSLARVAQGGGPWVSAAVPGDEVHGRLVGGFGPAVRRCRLRRAVRHEPCRWGSSRPRCCRVTWAMCSPQARTRRGSARSSCSSCSPASGSSL